MEANFFMRKIFLSLIILILVSSLTFADSDSEIESNAESHKIIGGLYSLAAAVELNGKINPDINSLVRFFERVPPGWQNEIKIERDKNKKSIWVGVAVKQNSSARSYLREHSKELGIFESPGGAAWLGSDFAWLKAADIVKKNLAIINFSAAEGDETIFFNAPKSNSWWAAWPSFNASSKRKILASRGTMYQGELVAPKFQEESSRVSIYDEVKPSSVRVPNQMHVGRRRSSFDMSVEVGDVIFNPIPNMPRR